MKDTLRKLVLNIRNVFTNELNKELSELSIEYFALHDKYEELLDDVRALEVD